MGARRACPRASSAQESVQRTLHDVAQRVPARAVVDDAADGLLQSEPARPQPTRLIDLEFLPKSKGADGIEDSPGRDEVQGGVSGAETAPIEDRGKATIRHQQIARDQVSVHQGWLDAVLGAFEALLP